MLAAFFLIWSCARPPVPGATVPASPTDRAGPGTPEGSGASGEAGVPPAEQALADLMQVEGPRLAPIAAEVLRATLALSPSIAAEAGLLEWSGHPPSFAPTSVARQVGICSKAMADLDALPWNELSVDQQIDARWLYANAETLRHELTVERRWAHRPAEWLEPVAGTLVVYASRAEGTVPLQQELLAQLPAAVDEMRLLVTEPTRRDVATASEVLDGILGVIEALPPGPQTGPALEALRSYRADLAELARRTDLPDYRVIGPDAYAWRLEHAMLLPWTPDELLAQAQAELDRVDAELAALEVPEPPPPTDEERAEAEGFDRETLLSLYDRAVARNLETLRAMGALTVPVDLAPMRARETPPPMIPLTGDGGSMNPPLLYGPATPGYWNVEHFSAEWTPEDRLYAVQRVTRQAELWFGPYAVHEGVPGHHLQLALARSIHNPTRTVLTDHASVEGWALYAEQLFWEHDGFGEGQAARASMLGSYRGRIRRVFYDVNTETGRWTLQQAAEWRAGKEGVEVDLDVLRAIQWPTQLIGYFAGKKQLLDLREEARARAGDTWDELAFHDAVLRSGQVPIALVRARVLGEPVPRW